MPPSRARVSRGRRTQVVVAQWLREHGWDRARAPVGAETGQDVKEVPGHSIEIKARTDFDPLAWLRQAKKNAEFGQKPCAVIRCNGQGETPGEYLVIRVLADDELAKGPNGSIRLRNADGHGDIPVPVVSAEFMSQLKEHGGTPDR